MKIKLLFVILNFLSPSLPEQACTEKLPQTKILLQDNIWTNQGCHIYELFAQNVSYKINELRGDWVVLPRVLFSKLLNIFRLNFSWGTQYFSVHLVLTNDNPSLTWNSNQIYKQGSKSKNSTTIAACSLLLSLGIQFVNGDFSCPFINRRNILARTFNIRLKQNQTVPDLFHGRTEIPSV
jgi:hypothetical protein